MSFVKGLLLLGASLLLITVCVIQNWSNFLLIFFAFALFFVTNKYLTTKKTLMEEREYFIQTLSHDLRVAAIAQFRALEILQKDCDNELIPDILEANKYSLDMMTMLISSYKLKIDNKDFAKEDFNLSAMLKNIKQDLRVELERKKITINQFANSDYWIVGNRVHFYKIFKILLEVAINDGIKNSEISVYVKKIKKDYRYCIDYKIDTKSKNKINRIFSKNLRFSTVGHGIKMNLCKKIIKSCGGSFYIKTDDLNYVTFEFLIPNSLIEHYFKPADVNVNQVLALK